MMRFDYKEYTGLSEGFLTELLSENWDISEQTDKLAKLFTAVEKNAYQQGRTDERNIHATMKDSSTDDMRSKPSRN